MTARRAAERTTDVRDLALYFLQNASMAASSSSENETTTLWCRTVLGDLNALLVGFFIVFSVLTFAAANVSKKMLWNRAEADLFGLRAGRRTPFLTPRRPGPVGRTDKKCDFCSRPQARPRASTQ